MSKLQDALGVGELLSDAAVSLPDWGLSHPDLGDLLTLDDVILASQTGSLAARDDVLFELAQRAHKDAGDDLEAAAVLCRLLVPGVVAKLGGMSLPATSDRVNQLAAGHLWVQCRTFPCDSRPKVAPTIVWNVRRAVLADLGILDSWRGDRTWANTRLIEPQGFDRLAADEEFVDPSETVAELLDAAFSERWISGEQVLLLATLLEVSGDVPGKRATRHGLLSDEVSRLVGVELGLGASTVRNRVSQAFSALRAAYAAAA